MEGFFSIFSALFKNWSNSHLKAMTNFHHLLSSVNLWALYTSCSEVKTGQTLSWSWPFFCRHEISHITANSLHPWTLFISLVFSGLACVGSLPLYLSTVFPKLAVWHMIQQRKIKKGTEQTVIDRNEKDKRTSQHFPPILLLLLFFHSLYLVLFFTFLTLCHQDFKPFKSVSLSLLQA